MNARVLGDDERCWQSQGMHGGSHRQAARRALSLGALVLTVAACSADPKANERYDRSCDAGQKPYKGFCVPDPDHDGGANAAGSGGDDDGGVDEGPGTKIGACDTEGMERPCYPNGETGAGSGPCKHGTQHCNDLEWSACDGDVAPSTELCNDVDDDCDGTKDDIEPDGSCMTTGQVGLCSVGEEACEDGFTFCRAVNRPMAETCNGQDDDCDAQEDEGTALPCYPDDTSGCVEHDDGSFTCVGQCATGVRACDGGEQGTCGGMTVPIEDDDGDGCTTGGGLALDDDCDGEIDEDCNCSTSAPTQACYGGAQGTELVTPCAAGTQTCNGTAYGECMDDRVPEQETCANEGVDDDCDGRTDEIPNRYMVCTDEEQMGVCRDGTLDCDGGGFRCATPAASDEQCNGLDDDCNGLVDNDFDLLYDEDNCDECGKKCSDGLRCCGGQCVDMNADENHCGACGDPCAEGSTCCGGTCVDTRVSTDHCGACGEACGAGRACCGGTCVDTRVSTNHCGACGEGCAPGEACCTGECADEDAPICAMCTEACENGEQCCFGSCVDQDSDESNCGACGMACDAGEICCGGDCVVSNADHCGQACNVCDSGDLCCSGTCVESDATHCNACNNVCPAGTTCCGELGCKNLQNDPNNCGTCGQAVGSGNICTSGHACAPNELWCNGACTNVLNNPNHCGICGRVCPILNTCHGLMCGLL